MVKTINLNFKKQIDSLSDLELIFSYKQNDNSLIIAELYKRYTDLCFLVSMKYLKNETNAEDMVMQIFEKLPNLIKNHEIASFKSWLYSVVKNECLLELRKRNADSNKHKLFEQDAVQFMETDQEMHLFNDENTDKLSSLKNAILSLKEEQKICIELFYFEEKSYDSIVEITGFTGKQVKSYIQNGKRNIMVFMSKNGIALTLIAFIYFLKGLTRYL